MGLPHLDEDEDSVGDSQAGRPEEVGWLFGSWFWFRQLDGGSWPIKQKSNCCLADEWANCSYFPPTSYSTLISPTTHSYLFSSAFGNYHSNYLLIHFLYGT